MSEKKEMKFEEFKKEMDTRFASLGFDRNSYGDQLLHAKVDILFYTLIKKGLVSMKEFVGLANNHNEMQGGIIAEFVNAQKEYDLTRR